MSFAFKSSHCKYSSLLWGSLASSCLCAVSAALASNASDSPRSVPGSLASTGGGGGGGGGSRQARGHRLGGGADAAWDDADTSAALQPGAGQEPPTPAAAPAPTPAAAAAEMPEPASPLPPTPAPGMSTPGAAAAADLPAGSTPESARYTPGQPALSSGLLGGFTPSPAGAVAGGSTARQLGAEMASAGSSGSDSSSGSGSSGSAADFPALPAAAGGPQVAGAGAAAGPKPAFASWAAAEARKASQ